VLHWTVYCGNGDTRTLKVLVTNRHIQVLVINNYGPTFYKALGYDTTQQLLLQAGWVTVAPPMCFVGGVLTDIVGRRPVILVGIAGCCFWLIVEACAVKYFTGHPERRDLGKLGVAAFYCFNVFYNPSMDDAANIYYAEVFPNHIRSKGVALTNLVLALSDLVYLQVTPYAFANIGWRYFLVFITISGVGVITLYFLLPESKGVPVCQLQSSTRFPKYGSY
jgi:MFS family permease